MTLRRMDSEKFRAMAEAAGIPEYDGPDRAERKAKMEEWVKRVESGEVKTISHEEMLMRTIEHLEKELATYKDHHARSTKALGETIVEREYWIAQYKLVLAENLELADKAWKYDELCK